MKKNNGITLIALIITIIIMLILVAVSISILINTGLIGKAKEASDSTRTSFELEQKTGGTLIVGGKGYNNIDEYMTSLKNKKRINWEQVLAAAQKHPDQENTDDIGVGTDGEPVNLDLWMYELIDDDEISLGYVDQNYGPIQGYEDQNVIDGKIQGKVPQYIKIDGESDFRRVTHMDGTFNWCESLTEAPEIPSTVTSMEFTFYNCSSLTESPEIPSGVTNMGATFSYCSSLTKGPEIPSSVTDVSNLFAGCESLTEAPEIPTGVTNMAYTFRFCESLTEAPEIPSGVTEMHHIFDGCTRLTEVPEIPNGVTNLEYAFYDCTSLTEAPGIPNGVTNMESSFSGCTSMTKAPEIPNSVKNMYYTFGDCNSLTGDLVINANPTNINFCLKSVATNAGCDLKLSGTSTKLNEILATKSSNSHISLKNP